MQSQPINIIELSHIYKNFDDRTALRNVTFNVRKGDFVAITGPNGGGKTTLLRIILQLIKPTSGELRFFNGDGNPIKHLNAGYLPQKNMIDSRFPITVEEVITSGMLGKEGLFHHTNSNDRRKVDDTIKLMGVESLRKEPIGNLSGGQLQRTLLGRALVTDPQVLVLDEPLSYVDKRFEEQIYRIIDDLAKNTTILLVSHEMTTIAQMANRHIIVDCDVHDCHASHHYIKTDCD